ncbi:hypothetical protein ACJ8VI_000788 [Providencia stuartii]|nr:hypothetical protein [Providencia stuartii]
MRLNDAIEPFHLMFLQFIEPPKQYADITVLRDGKNRVESENR